MLSLLAPWWLLGLALLPVIRWLHRGGPHRKSVRVSHLALWRGAELRLATPGERLPPDPAWRRRALLAALLFIALAGPLLPDERRRVTLWVDDSMSMLTREVNGTRIAQGLATARSLLAAAAPVDVDVRALGDPWRSLGALDDASAAVLVAGSGRGEPHAPPPALLRSDTRHWLLTDGADPTLFDWPAGLRPDRVIQVGSVTRNVGLERLSARRNPQHPDRFDVHAKVTNGGATAETRQVRFSVGAAEVASAAVSVEPGASVLVSVSIAASASVRATLQPGDALAEDDAIAVDLAVLRRLRVAIDPGCPRALVAAIAAHPALAVAPPAAADVDAALDCAAGLALPGVATLQIRAGAAPVPARGVVQWSPAVPARRRIALDSESLQVVARLEPGPADDVLLQLGAEPVVVRRAGPSQRVETALDFGSMAALRSPVLPLLVNLLFEQLLDRRLLDQSATTDRGPRAVLVAPLQRADAVAGAPAAVAAPPQHDAVRAVLGIALLALLWEVIALARQAVRLNARYGAAGA